MIQLSDNNWYLGSLFNGTNLPVYRVKKLVFNCRTKSGYELQRHKYRNGICTRCDLKQPRSHHKVGNATL